MITSIDRGNKRPFAIDWYYLVTFTIKRSSPVLPVKMYATMIKMTSEKNHPDNKTGKEEGENQSR